MRDGEGAGKSASVPKSTGDPGADSARPPLAITVKTVAELAPAPFTPVYEKRLIGKGIWYRHAIEGKLLWQCWKEVRPA